MTRHYAPRVSNSDAALRIFDALMAHPEGGSSAQLTRWTGMARSQVEKGKYWLTRYDDGGIFIYNPSEKIYRLTDDVTESRLYIIWQNRRAFRYQQSALRSTVKSERVASRIGGLGVASLYAQKASQLDALAGQKATLRQFGSEAGFPVAEIESWFTEATDWWTTSDGELLA